MKNKTLAIDNVVIEVTRRCNALCLHCLRGDQQNVNIKPEYVNSLFSKVKRINNLTISGGEPSIAVKSINHIIDSATMYNVEIGCFYIATNGLRITQPFVDAVERLYNFCNDNEISYVVISNDEYHPLSQETRALENLMSLSYVGKKWVKRSDDYYNYSRLDSNGRFIYDEKSIIDMGRANEMGLGGKEIELKYNKMLIEETDDELILMEGQIYLNCKGNVILGCDFSYEMQDDPDFIFKICHVDDFSFETINEYHKKSCGDDDLIEIAGNEESFFFNNQK